MAGRAAAEAADVVGALGQHWLGQRRDAVGQPRRRGQERGGGRGSLPEDEPRDLGVQLGIGRHQRARRDDLGFLAAARLEQALGQALEVLGGHRQRAARSGHLLPSPIGGDNLGWNLRQHTDVAGLAGGQPG